MQKVNGEEATISSFFSNWERLAPYLCEKETPEGMLYTIETILFA